MVADLDHSDLRGVKLTKANLSCTDLSNSDTHGTVAAEPIFSDVDLSEVDLRERTCWEMTLPAPIWRTPT